MKLYPNPFSKSFTAEFESPADDEMQAQLFSTNGVLVHSEKIIAKEGHNSYHFEADAPLIDGSYIFRLTNGSTVLAAAKVFCRND